MFAVSEMGAITIILCISPASMEGGPASLRSLALTAVVRALVAGVPGAAAAGRWRGLPGPLLARLLDRCKQANLVGPDTLDLFCSPGAPRFVLSGASFRTCHVSFFFSSFPVPSLLG